MANPALRKAHFLAVLPIILAACAGQPTGPSADPSTGAFTPVKVAYDDDGTVVYPVHGFRAELLDNEYQCRFWAFGRDGRNMRPCAGEAPSCGPPIPFSQVTVLDSFSPGGNEADQRSVDAPSLITEGTYRARIEATVQETTRDLARQVAREGCDLLVIEGEEWVSFFRGNNYRYLRVRWGSTAGSAEDQVAP